jgi:hypothetical protein
MSQQLQLRRNTQPTVSTFTGALGELAVDTTNNRVLVNDAVTAGGWAAAKLNDVSRLSFLSRSVNLNALGDTTVAIPLPQGMSIYRIAEIIVGHPSVVPTLAQIGVYTGAAETGVTIVAQQTLSGITTASQNTSGNAQALTLSLPTITTFNAASLFLNVGTVNGVPLTVDILIVISPLS